MRVLNDNKQVARFTVRYFLSIVLVKAYCECNLT